ncbi:NAD-dependent epimerase/dehydratase family protein [Dellaglioa sp. P0083]|uniref:NAD-dependent epimerase/dehydratase family protein n=1 Tax=Dellaglioa kimchii TaxID=3344667 RepID=UPI0038D4E84E
MKKKILITGANSYIAKSFKNWIELSDNKEISIDMISVRDGEWRKKDFGLYDTVMNVAGIAHVSSNPDMKDQYYKVNRDLAIDLAEKAKYDRVKQFIFLSSMIVYGEEKGLKKTNIINRDTPMKPIDFYGDSKLQADLAIQKLEDDKFKTVVIRTPMVYGPNSKGNFPKLLAASKKFSVFPKINNKRSMIYIDVLSEFIKQCILNDVSGVFFPQNKEYVSTSDIILDTRMILGKKTYLISIFNFLIVLLSKKGRFINRIYGNKVYERKLSNYGFSYDLNLSLRESIQKIINEEKK